MTAKSPEDDDAFRPAVRERLPLDRVPYGAARAEAKGPRHALAVLQYNPMMHQSAVPDVVPCEPDIDENGVDRAQIRQMLDLTPAERMLVIENLVDSIAEIRALNESRPVR